MKLGKILHGFSLLRFLGGWWEYLAVFSPLQVIPIFPATYASAQLEPEAGAAGASMLGSIRIGGSIRQGGFMGVSWSLGVARGEHFRVRAIFISIFLF